MALPQPDPSLPSNPSPVFSDIDAARGDHLRANNQAIWQNLEYLNTGGNIPAATVKTTPVDADLIPISDSAASFGLKSITWANIKAALLAYLRNIIYPTGSYLEFAGTSAPSGFLACDGTSYLRATYPDLFAVIGTTYGSADGTHFNVPDIRGISTVGAGANGTLTRADGSAYNGGSVGASRNDQFQGHYHKIQNQAKTVQIGVAGLGAGSLIGFVADSGTDLLGAKDAETDGTDGTPRVGNETRPAQMAVLVCIKT